MRKTYEKKRFYTQEQFESALSVDLLEFLKSRGYEFKKCGNEYHMKEHDSFVVSNNKWKWNSRGIGGGTAITFLTQVENMSYVDAVLSLCGKQYGEIRKDISHITTNPEPHKPKNLIVPNANDTAKHAFAYLSKTRLIDKDIISDLMKKGLIYESLEYFAKVKNGDETVTAKLLDNKDFGKLCECGIIDNNKTVNGAAFGYSAKKLKYIGLDKLNNSYISPLVKSGVFERVSYVNNCVFCGFDENREMKYAAMRGVNQNSSFRQDAIGSDKKYGFCMEGTGNDVFVFEAPIDAMSHATLYKLEGLDWKKDSRICLGGVSELALDQYLKTHPDTKNIHFCLDNDQAGIDNIYGVFDEKKSEYTTRSLLETYRDKGYMVSVNLPVLKDYNMDLQSYCKEQSKTNEETDECEL